MTEFDSIQQVIAYTTRYMCTYLAKVVNDSDPEQKSRVLVIIPALGQMTPSEGVWADVEKPICTNATPKVDDWLSVYFLDGNPSRPIVRGIVSTVKDNLPKTQKGKQLLYKDEDTEILIEQGGKIFVNCNGDITIKGGGKISVESSGDITVQGAKVTVNDHLEVS